MWRSRKSGRISPSRVKEFHDFIRETWQDEEEVKEKVVAYLGKFNRDERELLLSATDKTGYNAVFVAIQAKKIHIFEALLESGADINNKDASYSVVGLAKYKNIEQSILDVVERHKEHLAVPEKLVQAIKDNVGNDELEKILDKSKNKVLHLNKSLDANGRNAVFLAVFHNKPNALQALLESGAGYKTPDKSGYTALSHARVNGYEECVSILKKHEWQLVEASEAPTPAPAPGGRI